MRIGQPYYYVENNKIKVATFTDSHIDRARIQMNNCYESKNECLNKLKNLDE